MVMPNTARLPSWRCVLLIAIVLSMSTAVCGQIPPSWAKRAAEGNMLVSTTEPENEAFMATVGNGFVATIVGSNTTYMAGVFNGFSTTTPSHRARLPGTLSITVTNAALEAVGLDLEEGVYYRRMGCPGCARLETRSYAHRLTAALMVHEIEVTAAANAPAVLTLALNAGAASSDIDFAPSNLTTADMLVVSGSTLEPETPTSGLVEVAYATTPVPAGPITVPAGTTTTLYFLTAFSSALDAVDPTLAAIGAFQLAAAAPETLLPLHKQGWAAVWTSRVTVSSASNPAAATALGGVLNASLYYILSSCDPDWPWDLSPDGLASNGYNGHSFWDSATWMFPSIALLYPDFAAALMEYRANRLPEAHMKALSYNAGYTGAMMPWESAATGIECCPVSAPTGQLEQHISGDVVFAARQLFSLSGDLEWLAETGAPIALGVAEFWASRVTGDAASGYHILGVIPPDEYAVNVNDSVYTNVVASLALQFACNVSQMLGVPAPPAWAAIASGLVVLFDPETGVHPEYEGYAGETIKQADVILLNYPLGLALPEAVVAADLDYYLSRTDFNGPAMSWGMYAVGYLQLGNATLGQQLFEMAYQNNVQPPFNVWSEVAGGGGSSNFITGAGGFIQALWAGWGGLRIQPDGLLWNPQLPAGIDELALEGIHYRGAVLTVAFSAEGVTVTTLLPPPVPIVLRTGGNTVPIRYARQTIVFALAPFSISPK